MINNFWFWGFLAMFSIFMCTFIITSKKLGSNRLYGAVFVGLLAGSRAILVLPFIQQPRFSIPSTAALVIGISIFLVGIFLCIASASFINPVTKPSREEKLKTDGLYGMTRHPLMLGEILWPFGWSIIFQSIPGLLFSFFWMFCMYMFSIVEEERLVEEYGEDYLDYQRRVPKFIPRIRIKR